MSDKVLKIIFYVVVSIIFFYFLVSFFNTSVFDEKINTHIVEEATVDDYIVIEGIALRSETLLFSDKQFRNIRYFQNDGDRVARHSAYASYYDSEISPSDRQYLSYLNRNISRFENVIDKSTQYDILTIENNIREKLTGYLNNSEHSEFLKLVNSSYEVQSVFDQKLEQQYGTDYIQRIINSLEAERRDIYKSNNAQETTLYAPSAGYFISSADGYEYIDMQDYSSLTVQGYSELISMKPEPVSDLCVGKLQHYSYWYFDALIPVDYISEIYVGKTVYLDFTVNYTDNVRISTVVSSVSRTVDGKNAVCFKCSTLTDDLFRLRKETPKMVLKSYSGLKVLNDGLRVVNGETGVYVISAQIVVFKPVDIIYVTDTFSLVQPKSKINENRSLKVKDEIIIGGKDIFDGKIIRKKAND